ncbi:MAG: hypothetical protein IJT15_00845 [Rickettsiales bacterium]|nr:hypothetical protein [Rickettsiales bacterium]
MESKKEEKENNKQILSNALKALRECKEVSGLSEEHRNALNSADADKLYEAYLDIDTYFDKDKCFSIENPCCAYGLCAGGILATAALCGTVCCTNGPCAVGILTASTLCGTVCVCSGIPDDLGPGVGTVLAVPIIPMIAPAVGGVLALGAHKYRAKDKENEIKQIANDTEQYNDGEQDFLKKLKEIISFHSYYDTERDNIKNTIEKLCNSKQNYNKIPMEANNGNATINKKKEVITLS